MTGFGSAELQGDNKKITIEVKTINSKNLDFFYKTNDPLYKLKEPDLRILAAEILKRGKIEISIMIENYGKEATSKINTKLAENYYKDLKQIADVTKMQTTGIDYLQIIMHLPDVLINNSEEISETEWLSLRNQIIKAFNDTDEFRIKEGKILEKDIIQHIENILKNLNKIEGFEPQRINKIKDRIINNFNSFLSDKQIDNNRFEQELFFYIERMDFSEEKIRLKKHCDYFLETIKEEECGKKLSFISQEIGREINTLGSKANDANIQQLVVQMKDELEKIKEQLLNIL